MAPWKYYSKLILESIVGFYIATFCIAVFFLRHGSHDVPLAILQVTLYLIIVGCIATRIIKRFPPPALMLTVPIAPLLILIIVVTMLPLLERLQ
jgi:hypothetical protein